MKKKLLYYFFYLLPVIDIITALTTRFSNLKVSPGIFFKGIFLAIMIYYVIFISKSKYKKKSILFFVMCLIYFLSYFLSKSLLQQKEFLFAELIHAFKYFFFPTIFLTLLNLAEEKKITSADIKKILLFNLIIYSIFLLIPYFTNTGFSSYDSNKYSGTVGWFFSANEIGTLMILLFPFSYKLIDSKKIYKVPLIFLSIFAIYIIGTRVSMYGLVVISILMNIYFVFQKKKFGYGIFIASLITMVVILLSFNSSSTQNFVKRVDNDPKSSSVVYSEISSETIVKETNTSKNSNFKKLVNALLNGREKYLKNVYNIYVNANSFDKIFGIGFTNRKQINDNYITHLVEMDIVDILFRYGVIGFLIYMIPILYLLLKIIKAVFKKQKLDWHTVTLFTMLFLLALFISTFAGHVLSSPSVSIYVVFIMILIFIELESETFKKS